MITHRTSAIAYARNLANGKISGIQLALYKAISANPDQTAKELWEMTPALKRHQLDSIRNRPAELRKLGIIEPSGSRKDRHTGETAATWHITAVEAEDGDFAIKEPTRKELEAEVEALREALTVLTEKDQLEDWFMLRAPGKPGLAFSSAQKASSDVAHKWYRSITGIDAAVPLRIIPTFSRRARG